MKMDNLGHGRGKTTTGKTWIGALATALALAASVLLAPAQARADEDDIGWVGLKHNLRVDLTLGPTEKQFANGKQDGWYVYGNFEGGVFGKVSPLGNLGGLEFGLAMGYDGGSSNKDDDISDDRPLLGGFLYDMYVGFPITLFHKFNAATKKETLQIALSPGFGINHLHAYAVYLKGRATMALTDSLAAELQYTWHPGPTSATTYGPSQVGINQGAARGTIFWSLSDETSLLASLEFITSQVETEKPGKPVPGAFAGLNPFTQTVRTDLESSTRFSIGLAF